MRAVFLHHHYAIACSSHGFILKAQHSNSLGFCTSISSHVQSAAQVSGLPAKRLWKSSPYQVPESQCQTSLQSFPIPCFLALIFSIALITLYILLILFVYLSLNSKCLCSTCYLPDTAEDREELAVNGKSNSIFRNDRSL